jgi:hypothetical protein
MPKFHSAEEALDWAEKILSVVEGGRTNLISDWGGGGQGKNYAILDAIEIRSAAEAACRHGWPCPYLRHKCLFNFLLPDPLVKQEPISYAQETRILACNVRFDAILRKKGFIEAKINA